MPRWPARTWLALAAIALAAVAARALAFAGTELYADEAYYWLWSLRPAAGYYDHPPLVAWLVALSARAVPGELGVRLPFLLCGGLTVLFAGLLAAELAASPGEPAERARPALAAALLAASAPLLAPLGVLALPDGPLTASYTAALWLLARARGPRWAWAGLALGLALLSKYTAALLAPALLAVLPWDADLRRQLRTPWPWVGAAIALALFAPCLAWNARHGWASIAFQLGHGLGARGGGPAPLELAGALVAGAGPVALLAGLAHLARRRDPAALRVTAATLAPLVVTALSALRGRVEANWPALAYPALCAAAGCGLAGVRPALRRALVAGSAAVALALLAAFAVVQRRPALLPGSAVVERFQGWREAARGVRQEAARACPELGCDPAQPYLVPVNYQFAAELAFYGGFRRFGPALERPSQLDLWDTPLAPGEPFLFIGLSGPPAGGLPGHGAAAGPTVQVQSRRAGLRLRDLSVTPFARYAGPAAKR